jgi:hypothetical protein
VPPTYPLSYSTAWFDDATADFDATERVPEDTRARARWHEKTAVAIVFGSLAVVGLAVLAIAVLMVSNESTHPDVSRHPVVASTSPAPSPATSVPPSPLPIAADPPPTAAPPPPTEASPDPTAIQTPAATPHPGGPDSGWPRWRRWLWAHQHPNG